MVQYKMNTLYTCYKVHRANYHKMVIERNGERKKMRVVGRRIEGISQAVDVVAPKANYRTHQSGLCSFACCMHDALSRGQLPPCVRHNNTCYKIHLLPASDCLLGSM